MMMYVLYQTCYSCYHMPYTALTVYISSEPAQRDQATGFRMMFEVISLLVASILQGAFLSGAKVFSQLVILILICYLSVALLGVYFILSSLVHPRSSLQDSQTPDTVCNTNCSSSAATDEQVYEALAPYRVAYTQAGLSICCLMACSGLICFLIVKEISG